MYKIYLAFRSYLSTIQRIHKQEISVASTNSDFEPMSRRKVELSKHAQKRTRQRGIGAECLPLLMAYGRKEFDGKGGVRYLMTAESISLLTQVVGFTQKIDALAGVYAVVSAEDQTVITVGHRH